MDHTQTGQFGAGANDAGDAKAASARAIVLVPVLSKPLRDDGDDGSGRPRLTRSPEARLDEAVGLANAIDLDTVYTEIVNVADPKPATLIGAGKVAEIAEKVAETSSELVVVDHPLTPVQQRNLEKQFNAKVLDRTGIILEIFGRRARTREGTLQVELAHLNYQRGRLVRSWTHLERQRGGIGVRGGAGEKQIDVDRNLMYLDEIAVLVSS